jgi:hypothetical protein
MEDANKTNTTVEEKKSAETKHAESMPSESNTEPQDNDDEEFITEAKEGGLEILPVSSTSKLSANIGLSEVEFVALKKSNPAEALKMLLTKTTRTQASSDQTPSDSAQSDSQIRSSIQ